MFLSDSLPSEIRFRQAYTLSFYLSVMGRVSPVPNHTFHIYRFLYTEGFFCAAFQFLRTFHGFRPYAQGSTPLCSLFRDLFLTIRQNSLNVTVCMIACTFYQGYFIHSLSTLHYYSAPSLATQLTGDYRDRTYTGKCGPASLDTRYQKRHRTTHFLYCPAPELFCEKWCPQFTQKTESSMSSLFSVHYTHIFFCLQVFVDATALFFIHTCPF